MDSLLLYAPALRACAVAASSDTHKHALNHILVEPFNDRFRYVATDGHVLLAVEAPGPLEMLLGMDGPDKRLYIHRDALKSYIPSARAMEAVVPIQENLKNPGFPQYRKLVTQFGSTQPSGVLSLGIPILKKLNSIGAALGCSAMHLQSTGENNAATMQIDMGDVTAYGMVMPVMTRSSWAAPATIAEWFSETDQAAS